jgi:predicted  nucleic acid-binding Zn-ribbon protein
MRHPSKRRILPKISTMPCQQTEAAAVLDIYKLAIEKGRLQQELQSIEQRQRQILKRLVELEDQIERLETKAQQMRGTIAPTIVVPKLSPSPQSEEFDILFLDY